MVVRNNTPLLFVLPAVTITGPVATFAGTVVVIEELLHDKGDAATPLNVIVPTFDPKFLPLIVTEVPAVPELGRRP
jgi:hypothetical protein